MSAKARPRFDIDALRKIAGAKVFARGEAYFRAGQVDIVSIGTGRVLARVAGSEDYRTVITGKGAQIAGECSCPAFETWPICKHMVATALAANAAAAGGGTEAGGAEARIRHYLMHRPPEALVEMIVDLAERDPALFRRLEIAAATLQADDRTLEASLRKAIDDATRTRGFVDYDRAQGWAAGVESALDALAGIAGGPRAGLVLKLAEHAVARIERAIDSIDDSDGHCGDLLEQARDVHLAACRAARPEPVELARDLFAREMEGEYDTFRGAAELYLDVLGEAGLAEYRRLATAAWDKLPPRQGPRHGDEDFDFVGPRLASILDFFAEREGDVDLRIAIRAKDLSSPWHYLRLAEFCRAEGREDAALHYAEEGLWVHEDARPDARLALFAADLLAKAGRTGDAAEHLWRAFEKAPGLDLYARLRRLGGKGARARAIAGLEARLAAEAPGRWHATADLLVLILKQEKMIDAAWAAVHAHGASSGVRDDLAGASETTHPGDALKVYAERVEELVRQGGSPGYAEACRLIARMAGLRGAAEQAAYVADLRTRFQRKRNFIRLLA